MTTLIVIGANQAALGDARLRAAQLRYGLSGRFGSIETALRNGTAILVLADVGDADPDADIAILFVREPTDSANVIWVNQLWGRSARLLRVYEGALVLMRLSGIVTARVGKGTLPYTTAAVQIGQAANAVVDGGTWWDFDTVKMLPAVRAVITAQGTPPL